MKGRSNGAHSDWEFIRAAQIERRECQQAHDVSIKLELGLDEVRSVILISAVAYEVAEMGQQVVLAKYVTSWPNAHVQTFTACLFQAAVKLTRLVEDCRRDEALIGAQRHQIAS